MKLWCYRPHYLTIEDFHDGHSLPMRHTPGGWAICAICQNSEALRNLLIAAGFLAADEDGGRLYWRLRFWRPSLHRRFAWDQLRERRA